MLVLRLFCSLEVNALFTIETHLEPVPLTFLRYVLYAFTDVYEFIECYNQNSGIYEKKCPYC